MLTLKERQEKDKRIQAVSFGLYRSQFEELRAWKEHHNISWTEMFQEILKSLPKN